MFINGLFVILWFIEEFVIEPAGNYTFLTNGGLPVPGVDDVVEFQATVQSMEIMGMGIELTFIILSKRQNCWTQKL